MIDSKLTLKLDSDSINRAKLYSNAHKISLSALVEKFFDSLTLSEQTDESSFKYSPIVNELSGIISIPEDYDLKSDYIDYLDKKYE